MEEKSRLRRTFGMVLLVYAGIMLAGEVIILLFPSILTNAGVERPWYRHISSLVLSIGSGAFGLYLRGKRLGENFVWGLTIGAILISPLLMIEGAIRNNDAHIQPLIRFGSTWVLISGAGLALAFVPHIFRSRLLTWFGAKPTRAKISPQRTLHIIAVALSMAPANAGFYLSRFGAPKTDIYYFVFVSYLCAAIWWVMWRFSYRIVEGKQNI